MLGLGKQGNADDTLEQRGPLQGLRGLRKGAGREGGAGGIGFTGGGGHGARPHGRGCLAKWECSTAGRGGGWRQPPWPPTCPPGVARLTYCCYRCRYPGLLPALLLPECLPTAVRRYYVRWARRKS